MFKYIFGLCVVFFIVTVMSMLGFSFLNYLVPIFSVLLLILTVGVFIRILTKSLNVRKKLRK